MPDSVGDSESNAILTRMMGLHPKIIDLSLGRTTDLLEKLGRPHDHLPPVVHVAGTNGKGSTIAALRAIAETAGYTVHTYTSPHLVRFHERINLAGQPIEEDRLIQILEQCEAINENRPITFFEITTCAAFKAFAETPADLLLLETGLGGRLDSTNVVTRVAATAITPVSMDHMQFLGNTLSAIAREKAAIQKPGIPAIVGPQHPEALSEIVRRAETVGAPLFRNGVEWELDETEDGGFRFLSPTWSGDLPAPSLAGAHQRTNAATAVALALTLRGEGFDLPDQALRDGLTRIHWPARMQPLTRGPIPRALPGWTITLDGGHNPAAGEALSAQLRHVAEQDRTESGRPRPVHAICGMMNSKAASAFLAPLAPHLASISCVGIPDEPNSFSAEELTATAQQAGIAAATPCDGIDAAISALPGEPARLLICGSLYLAGHVLAQNG